MSEVNTMTWYLDIYDYVYTKSGGIRTGKYTKSIYYSWMLGGAFSYTDACILGTNGTDKDIKITKIKVKAGACNSGTDGPYESTLGPGWYYTYGNPENVPRSRCKGYGATFQISLDIINRLRKYDGTESVTDTSFIKSSTKKIDDTNIVNIGSYGSPVSGSSTTASFFNDDQHPLPENEFTFEDAIIKPGEYIYVHFGIISLNHPDDPGSTNIKFSMKPSEMTITEESGDRCYIWRYNGSEWVLDRNVKVYRPDLDSTNKWVTVDKPGIYYKTT